MLFVEFRFLVFFVVVFAAHWAMRGNALRKSWLLLCSYAFYAAWDWRFLGLIWLSTAIDYLVSLGLGRAAGLRSRRALLLTSLAANLGLLGFFKYHNFFASSLADLTAWLGLGVIDATMASIVLPVGISFYTFQTLSYTIDVYRGRIRPTRNLLDVALFVGFFPQLVAGPIVRAETFLPQLVRRNRLSDVDFRWCLTLFWIGFVKKACVADNFAPFVDAYFANASAYDAPSAWLAIVLYAVQIYCDFSGYSDMAIAGAGMLGYHFPPNFAFPYFAPSIVQFWRRWHISLSTWLRDYLYVPLGGNHGGRWFTRRNLMLTMVLGGLWHGAAWSFVIWGTLHGVALAVAREWHRWAPADEDASRLRIAVGTGFTFWWVCVAWIFFRAPDLSTAILISKAFVLGQSPGDDAIDPRLWLWLVPLTAAHWLAYRSRFARISAAPPTWAYAAGYAVAWTLALTFVPVSYTPFIYFQF